VGIMIDGVSGHLWLFIASSVEKEVLLSVVSL